MEPVFFVVKDVLDTYSIVRKRSDGIYESSDGGYSFETQVPDAGDRQVARTLCRLLNKDYFDRLEQNKKLRAEWEALQKQEEVEDGLREDVGRTEDSDE